MEKITNLTKMSDEDIQDVFSIYFEKQVAKPNNIDEFEVSCERDSLTDSVVMKVMVVGFAGTPTPQQFKNEELEDIASIKVPVEDSDEDIVFFLDAESTTSLNTNDYWVFYRLIS